MSAALEQGGRRNGRTSRQAALTVGNYNAEALRAVELVLAGPGSTYDSGGHLLASPYELERAVAFVVSLAELGYIVVAVP